MDANERLRRYLEQRREVGESELVLDGLPVEDVLAMLGAKRGTAAPSTTSAPRATRAATHAPPESTTRTAADTPVVERDVTPPAPIAVPEPEVRFSANAPTDWREILRPATAAPGAPTSSTAATAGASSGSTPTPDRSPSSLASPPALATDALWPAWIAALGLPTGLSIGAAQSARNDAAASLPSLDAIADAARACTACALHASATNAVPGEGNPTAEFLCVGEAPGANEDAQGRPFVGDAGQLLTKILGAIQLQRDDVYICNVLKHRPPGNRDPLPDEVRACQPFLLRQLELVKPRVILALGRFAAQTLLQTTSSIGSLRGQLHRFHGIPLIVTYHPAALLRNESWKRPTWDDVKLARRVLDAARVAADAERGA